MLWYIVIQNDRRQDNDYMQYEWMGHHVQIRRREERLTRSIVTYKAIQDDGFA
jgi:hypothetical protein